MPPSVSSPPATPFPTYLIPSPAWRPRPFSNASSLSSSSNASPTSSPPSSLADDPFLAGQSSYLRCAQCLADLAPAHQIISKGFTGRHGRAYLVAASPSSISPALLSASAKSRNDALSNLPNVSVHKAVPRQLATGAHTVGDVTCRQCGTMLGWKYIAAEEESQRYKVGKFILETKRVCRSSTWDTAVDQDAEWMGPLKPEWDHCSASSTPMPPTSSFSMKPSSDDIEFDSQDEDECEDLFLGVWSPQLAMRRRRAKQNRKL